MENNKRKTPSRKRTSDEAPKGKISIKEADNVASAVLDAPCDCSAFAAVDFIAAVSDMRVFRCRTGHFGTGIVLAAVIDRDDLIISSNA